MVAVCEIIKPAAFPSTFLKPHTTIVLNEWACISVIVSHKHFDERHGQIGWLDVSRGRYEHVSLLAFSLLQSLFVHSTVTWRAASMSAFLPVKIKTAVRTF